MSSIQLHVLHTPKAKLYKTPKSEQSFFILAGHIVNEIESLNKIMIWILNYQTEDPIEEKIKSYFFLMFARIQAGKIYEAWKQINQKYYGAKISKVYDPLLPNDAKQALNKMKTYFKISNNVIAAIRNDFSFHYPDNPLSSFSQLKATDDWHVYLAENNINCYFLISEILINHALFARVAGSDIRQGVEKVANEITEVAGSIVDFFSGWHFAFAKKYLQAEVKRMENRTHKVVKLRNLREIPIPFFCTV